MLHIHLTYIVTVFIVFSKFLRIKSEESKSSLFNDDPYFYGFYGFLLDPRIPFVCSNLKLYNL